MYIISHGVLESEPEASEVPIDTPNNEVLFAEAGKGFVDFLFNLLALPVGTVNKTVDQEWDARMLGKSMRKRSES